MSDNCAAVSQAIVDLVRTRTGRAPTTAKTEMASHLAIVTFDDGFTESSLYQAMRTDAVAAVEAITGRQVAAYLAEQHDPDRAMIAFVFGPREPA